MSGLQVSGRQLSGLELSGRQMCGNDVVMEDRREQRRWNITQKKIL